MQSSFSMTRLNFKIGTVCKTKVVTKPSKIQMCHRIRWPTIPPYISHHHATCYLVLTYMKAPQSPKGSMDCQSTWKRMKKRIFGAGSLPLTLRIFSLSTPSTSQSIIRIRSWLAFICIFFCRKVTCTRKAFKSTKSVFYAGTFMVAAQGSPCRLIQSEGLHQTVTPLWSRYHTKEMMIGRCTCMG